MYDRRSRELRQDILVGAILEFGVMYDASVARPARLDFLGVSAMRSRGVIDERVHSVMTR